MELQLRTNWSCWFKQFCWGNYSALDWAVWGSWFLCEPSSFQASCKKQQWQDFRCPALNTKSTRSVSWDDGPHEYEDFQSSDSSVSVSALEHIVSWFHHIHQPAPGSPIAPQPVELYSPGSRKVTLLLIYFWIELGIHFRCPFFCGTEETAHGDLRVGSVGSTPVAPV